MATVPPPPPPPPVGRPAVQYSQSHLHGTSPSLPRSERPSTNSNNVGSVRSSAATPNKRPFADVDDATLQRAAQRLRKTGNYEQILSSQPISSQGMGRQAELPVGGYRQNSSEYATVAEHPTGKPVYAQDPSPYASTAIGQHHGYPVPIIQQQSQTPGQQNYSSSSSSYTTTQTTNYNSVQPPPLPTSFPPPSFGLSQQFPAQSFSPAQNTYSSQTTYHYVDPQNYTIKETYQSQPTNNNGIQTYKTYTSTTTNSYTDSNQQQPTEQQNINQQQLPSSINNPQKYLYDFATRTPIAVLSPEQQQINNNSDQSSSYSYSYSSTNNNSVPGPKQPLTYAEELRNSSLTSTQQQYNQYQKSQLPERQIPGSFHQLYEESIRANKRTDQVDDLVKDMEARLRTGIRDICAKCNTPIVGDTPGVTALGKPYHVNCFSCDACQKQLAGCSFYNVDGKNLCQVDYMNSLEKCSKCATPITQKILRALGQAFHPECFVCPSCQKSLDGIPFTVTKENSAYCLDCYHEKFSPRCAACLKAIAPSGNETEVARVIAMDKSYHVACYRCEDCGLQLNSKVEGAACYPLESHLFCRNCNLNRLKATC